MTSSQRRITRWEHEDTGLRFPGRGDVALATRTVPIVFRAAVDPVGAGFVDSLSRLGSNATGFSGFEYSLGAKWLE